MTQMRLATLETPSSFFRFCHLLIDSVKIFLSLGLMPTGCRSTVKLTWNELLSLRELRGWLEI